MNPLFLIDFYKVGHVSQYPEDTTQIWSNWTPRSTRIEGATSVVFFGLQYFIKEILLKEWNENFFRVPLPKLLTEYQDLIKATLGVDNPKTDHIEALWNAGFLPLDIYALPEGTNVPLRVPMLVVTNTLPEFYWLPNYFETILSNILWKPCTSATTAQRYRKIFTKYALEAGEKDLSFIDWQGHDFSFRGTSGREDAILSGMGHLLSFSGTDTVPAIVAANEYYNAGLTVGGSVPATEHSVMCAGSQERELDTFYHLITKVYPTGIVSIVSDTWDLWKVLIDYIPALKDIILARDGKVVIRPDSGDPVKILCGDQNFKAGQTTTAAQEGVLRLLVHAMGTVPRTDGGLPMINKAGAIYGDSITPDRAEEILSQVVRKLKLSPFNVVFGIGSFTYEYTTRDAYGFAMKATAIRRGGKIYDIFKKPVTDNGEKNSLRGIPAVYYAPHPFGVPTDSLLYVVDGQKPEALDNCAFRKVFSNGELLINENFDIIRRRVR